MALADTVNAEWHLSARPVGSTGSYTLLPITNITFGSDYEVRVQATPNYSFVKNHYYDITLYFQHSYGIWSFDRTTFLNLGYNSVSVTSQNVNSQNLDSYRTTTTIFGVSSVDAVKVIERIRFFFNCSVTSSGSTTSGSLFIGDKSLDISDVTTNYVVPEINSKLDSTNQKLDESNQKKQTIIDRITNLPNALKDMLLGVFIPDQEDMTEISDNFNTLLEDRFGGLYQVFGYLEEFASIFVSGSSSGSLYIPELAVDIPLVSGQIGQLYHLEIWHGGDVSVFPSNSQFNSTFLNAIKFGIDFIALVFVFRFFLSIFSAIFISEQSTALYMATLMNDYNEEEEWDSYVNKKGSWKGV